MLLGRTSELEYLQQFYQKISSQLLIVYGQIGIGKTSLLLEFAKNIPYFYYLARPCSGKKQQEIWRKELKEKGSNQKTGNKKVIIIDEFQHMIKSNKTFMNDCIDYMKEQQEDVLIILASSSIAWIENSMISKIGTAAYSISALYKIKELSFQTIRTMFPAYNRKQCLEVYSIFGGVPGLLVCIDGTADIRTNICNTLLSPNAILKQKGNRLVSEELRETAVYNTILESIASGKMKLNELYLETEFSRAKISVYLKNLMELEFVEKVFSYDTEGKENTKKGVYQICNHFVHFWFRFIFPNLSQLVQMKSNEFYDTFINAEFTNYNAFYFKNICLEYIFREAEEKRFPINISRSGEWIGKVGSIDIILEDEAGRIVAAFCKFGNTMTTYEDYEWNLFCLEKAVIQPEYIYLFSVNGFEEKLILEAKVKENVRLVDFTET